MDTKLINTLERLICPKGVPYLDFLENPIHDGGKLLVADRAVGFLFDEAEAQPCWASLDDAIPGDRKQETFLNAGHSFSRYSSQKGDPVTIPPISVQDVWLDPYAAAKSTCKACFGGGFKIDNCNYDHSHECTECNGTGLIDTLAIDGVAKGSTRINSWLFGDRYLWILSQFAEQVESEITLIDLGDHAIIRLTFDGGHALLISMIEFKAVA